MKRLEYHFVNKIKHKSSISLTYALFFDSLNMLLIFL